ncbi:MAG: CopG family transcriptional regulator [Spirochaetaceae bacterium]|jgi:predicted DNA-binding protein|nr:CopG family transcriptional regulator [Spirochaetaceae bacterium]
MTSLRLPVDVEQKVFSFARTRNQSKSAVIIAALEQFFEQEEEVDSFELGKNYFGRFGSSQGGRLSADYKKLMKGKILDKYRSC